MTQSWTRSLMLRALHGRPSPHPCHVLTQHAVQAECAPASTHLALKQNTDLKTAGTWAFPQLATGLGVTCMSHSPRAVTGQATALLNVQCHKMAVRHILDLHCLSIGGANHVQRGRWARGSWCACSLQAAYEAHAVTQLPRTILKPWCECEVTRLSSWHTIPCSDMPNMTDKITIMISKHPAS